MVINPLIQHWLVFTTVKKTLKKSERGGALQSGGGRGEVENTNKCTAICTLYQKHLYKPFVGLCQRAVKTRR